MKNIFPICALLTLSFVGTAAATPIMYVHDSSGTLGKVDVESGNVEVVGSMGTVLTDIAFNSSGELYGVSFTGLYSIDPETATTTFIGKHSISGANALVFSEDGTLYSAGSSTSSLFTIDTMTGSSSLIGDMGFYSGGDLAFNGDNFYLASSSNTLVDIDLDDAKMIRTSRTWHETQLQDGHRFSAEKAKSIYKKNKIPS